jgi:hypothetical protein
MFYIRRVLALITGSSYVLNVAPPEDDPAIGNETCQK